MEQAICPDCGNTVALRNGRIIEHGPTKDDSSAMMHGTWNPPYCKSSGQSVEPKRGKLLIHGFPMPLVTAQAIADVHRPLAVVLGLREE